MLEILNFVFLLYDAIDWRVRKNDSTIKTFRFFFGVRTGNSHFIEKRDICFYFCSLLSLIFCHNSGRCFSFLYFLYKCTEAGRLFPDRESVSWGFPNGPVKLFCSPSIWRFQSFENSTIKLLAKETKLTSYIARLLLYPWKGYFWNIP